MTATPRVLVVIGTRPEAIKMAPVIRALREAGEVETRVALTGQHTSLVDQANAVLGIHPDYDLGIMREGQTLYDVAHGCLDGLRDVVRECKPAAILVQGDTATVCFGAMVGFFEDVKVGHVEAGLRSFNKRQPFPEEMFRRVSDLLSDWHLAPTRAAAENLLSEGMGSSSVHVTGNTVVDALEWVSMRLPAASNPALKEALESDQRLVLLTAHRRESFGEPIREVFRAVREVADRHDDVTILYPVHPNPNVRGPADELLSGHPRIVLTDPLDYFDLVHALKNASLVLTDSGGIQEEAPTFGVPVLVLREVTERPEGVEAGAAELIGTNGARLIERASQHLRRSGSPLDELMQRAMLREERANPYGDGRAGERIADIVTADLLGRPRRTTDWGST